MRFPTKYDPKLHGYEWLEPIDDGKKGFHPGIDFNYKNDKGQDVIAITYGIVKHAGCCGSWGNHVLIHHPEYEVYSHYAHLDAICVKESDQVEEGQFIGPLGNTGNSRGSHLHFEIRLQKMSPHVYVNKNMTIEEIKTKYTNPEEWIKEKIYQEETIQKRDKKTYQQENLMMLIQDSSRKVYLVGKDGKKHWIFDEETFNTGKEMGLWGDWSEVKTMDNDSYEEGHTIILSKDQSKVKTLFKSTEV